MYSLLIRKGDAERRIVGVFESDPTLAVSALPVAEEVTGIHHGNGTLGDHPPDPNLSAFKIAGEQVESGPSVGHAAAQGLEFRQGNASDIEGQAVGPSSNKAPDYVVDTVAGAMHDAGVALQALTRPKYASVVSPAAENADGLQSAVSFVSSLQPLLDKLDAFNHAMVGLAKVGTAANSFRICLIPAQVHPYATMAWTILSGAYNVSNPEIGP